MKKTLIIFTILLCIIVVIFIFFKDSIPGLHSNKGQNQPTNNATTNRDTNNPTDTSNNNINNPKNTNNQNTNPTTDVNINEKTTQKQNNTNPEKTSLINKDLSIASTTPQTPQTQNQKQLDGNQKDIVYALSKQLGKTNLQFFGTVVVYPYAIQSWSDGYMGGFALLKHTELGVWFLLNAGGGNIDYGTLMKLNINPSIAMDLINGLNKQ